MQIVIISRVFKNYETNMEISSSHRNANLFSVEIESLRGILALSVMLGHFYLLTTLSQLLQTSSRTISTLIAGFFNPQPAVLLFFTISGFVLGRQLRKNPINSVSNFMAYLCQRAFRLIPLMWAATLFAFILYCFKETNICFSMLYANLLLKNISLNQPLWSLKVELCCSIVFPLLFWIFVKGNKMVNASLFIILCWLSYFWHDPIFIQFLVFFHAGLLIDYINMNCKKNYRIVNRLSLIFFYLVFMLAPEFSIGSRMWGYGHWQSWVLPEIPACSFILFYVIYNNSYLNHFLRLSFVRYLGKISFSIYLFHFPLLKFMLVKIKAENSMQFLGFTVTYFALVFLIATATYHWIEIPTNRFGKMLSSILFGKNRLSAFDSLSRV